MVRLSAFTLASLAGAASAFAIDHVVPGAYVAAPGGASFLGPLANSARTYQLLIHSNELAALVGQDITGLTWRLLPNASAPWPSVPQVFSSFDVYLSPGVEPASRSLTFANNIAGTQTQVRAGSLLIGPNVFPSGGSPNAFGSVIEFDQPWNYTGGHVLVELRHTGVSGTSATVDAPSTSSAGYGSLYSACWTGNYTGTAGSQGNFGVTRFRGSTPGATGACCRQDGTCAPGLTFVACRAASGIWGGQDSQCATANCPQLGACCRPDGTCDYVLESLCSGLGSTWSGPNVQCAAANCPLLLPTPDPTSFNTLANASLFFDLTASTALNLTQIDYFPEADAGAAVTATVYYKTGTYVGNDTNAGVWTQIPAYNTTSVGGTSTPTHLVLPTPIPMAPGEIVGVYVVGTVGGIRYRATASPNPVSDAALSLESNLFRSAVFGGTATTGRRFAGWVHYELPSGSSCYANCDGSTGVPFLNVGDFTCFLQKFAAQDAYANCDGSTAAPTLNVGDFTCFLTKFASSCSAP